MLSTIRKTVIVTQLAAFSIPFASLWVFHDMPPVYSEEIHGRRVGEAPYIIDISNPRPKPSSEYDNDGLYGKMQLPLEDQEPLFDPADMIYTYHEDDTVHLSDCFEYCDGLITEEEISEIIFSNRWDRWLDIWSNLGGSVNYIPTLPAELPPLTELPSAKVPVVATHWLMILGIFALLAYGVSTDDGKRNRLKE